MAIYKGRAYCAQTIGTGSRFFAVSIGDSDGTPNTQGDGGIWSQTVGTGQVTVFLSQSTSGLTPPAAPNSVIVTLYEADTNTILATTTVSPGSTNLMFTMWATDTGFSSGTPVVGDYRIYVRAIRNDLGTYDVNSDSQDSSGVLRISPTSMTLTAWHTGTSNPACWGDSLMLNVDLSNTFNLQRPHRHFTMEARNSDTSALYATDLTEGTDPQNGEIVITDVFPSGEVPVDIDAVVIALPSTIAPDSEPDATWIVVPPATSGYINPGRARAASRMPVNAGITVDHHLQLNDNVPATTKDVESKQRLTSDLGFVGFRLVNARDEGLNGITATETLKDASNLVAPAINRSVTTATALGEPGWTPTLVAWDSALPGGTWVHEVTVTTSTANSSVAVPAENFTLLAINPNLQMVVAGGHPAAANQNEHWHPGDDLLIGVGIYDSLGKHLETLDDDPAPTVVIGRFNTTFGVAQYLASDFSWQVLSGVATAYEWPLVASPGDPNVYLTQLPGSVTASFSHASLFFVGQASVNGTPYSGTAELPAPGPAGSHGRSYEVMTAGGPTSKPDHWHEGEPFQAGLAVIDMQTGMAVAPDGYTQVAIMRLQDEGLQQGNGEYLDANGVWQPYTGGAAAHWFDCVESRPGSNLYIKTFVDTTSWGTFDIFVLGRAKVGFFEFHNYFKEVGVGGANRHSGHTFDPVAFALNGVISSR